jgi:hypothetical protein
MEQSNTCFKLSGSVSISSKSYIGFPTISGSEPGSAGDSYLAKCCNLQIRFQQSNQSQLNTTPVPLRLHHHYQ